MILFRVFLASLLVSLASCQTSEVLDVGSGDPQPADARPESEPAASPPARSSNAPAAKECAVYYAIVGQMYLENCTPSEKMLQGCPPETSVGADISSSGAAVPGTTAGALTRRMIDRGVPGDIARQVSRSKAFRNWLDVAGQ